MQPNVFKVLITGGGFLSQRLGRHLVGRGHAVRFLDVAEAPAPGLGALVFDMPGVVASIDDFIAELKRQVPGARITARGAARPIAPDIAPSNMTALLGDQPITSLADGIAATLAACRAS